MYQCLPLETQKLHVKRRKKKVRMTRSNLILKFGQISEVNIKSKQTKTIKPLPEYTLKFA